MDWRRTLAPLGVPTVIVADDPALLATACDAYPEWRTEGPEAEPVIELRLKLGDDPGDEAAEAIAVEGSRLTLTGAGILGQADAVSKRAHCVVPRRLLGDASTMAESVTDTLLLFLLARTGRTPMHAAGVMVGDTALVLAGPSGTGKSTLALAAAERGLRILSDDTLYIQLQPATRIWGFQRPLHVFPQDAPRFTGGTRLRGGKLKAVVPLPQGSAGVDA